MSSCGLLSRSCLAQVVVRSKQAKQISRSLLLARSNRRTNAVRLETNFLQSNQEVRVPAVREVRKWSVLQSGQLHSRRTIAMASSKEAEVNELSF